MNHLFQSNPFPCQPFRRPTARANRLSRASFRRFLLLPAAGVALACASCSEGSTPAPPPVPVTDTKPVGEGLKVIGYALLGAAVVLVLGKLLR